MLWVHISGQLEVFEGVKGDVTGVHHGKDYLDVTTLEAKLLDGCQVWNRPGEAGTKHQSRSHTGVITDITLNAGVLSCNIFHF